jgi:hypothetical protein
MTKTDAGHRPNRADTDQSAGAIGTEARLWGTVEQTVRATEEPGGGKPFTNVCRSGNKVCLFWFALAVQCVLSPTEISKQS